MRKTVRKIKLCARHSPGTEVIKTWLPPFRCLKSGERYNTYIQILHSIKSEKCHVRDTGKVLWEFIGRRYFLLGVSLWRTWKDLEELIE